MQCKALQVVSLDCALGTTLIGDGTWGSSLKEVHVPRERLALQLFLQCQPTRDVSIVHDRESVLGFDLLLLEETLTGVAVHPHHRHTHQVARDVVVVHLVRELRSERVSHEAVLRNADLSSTQPRAQRDFDVLASPASHAVIHLSRIPPFLARGEHAHGDRREVVVSGAASPDNAQ